MGIGFEPKSCLKTGSYKDRNRVVSIFQRYADGYEKKIMRYSLFQCALIMYLIRIYVLLKRVCCLTVMTTYYKYSWSFNYTSSAAFKKAIQKKAPLQRRGWGEEDDGSGGGGQLPPPPAAAAATVKRMFNKRIRIPPNSLKISTKKRLHAREGEGEAAGAAAAAAIGMCASCFYFGWSHED